MTSKSLWCGILIVALWVALSPSAEAQDKIVSNGTIVGVIVGVVAAVAYVAIHESSKKRRTIVPTRSPAIPAISNRAIA